MEQQPHCACERTKFKQKVMSYSNRALVPLFDLLHKQCNGIIKGWFHFLTSESKERFLVITNYINVFVSMIFGRGANPIFFNKKVIKITRPEHSLTRHLPTSNNISFLPYPLLPFTPKVDVIYVSVPISVSTIKLIIISKFRTLKF